MHACPHRDARRGHQRRDVRESRSFRDYAVLYTDTVKSGLRKMRRSQSQSSPSFVAGGGAKGGAPLPGDHERLHGVAFLPRVSHTGFHTRTLVSEPTFSSPASKTQPPKEACIRSKCVCVFVCVCIKLRYCCSQHDVASERETRVQQLGKPNLPKPAPPSACVQPT